MYRLVAPKHRVQKRVFKKHFFFSMQKKKVDRGGKEKRDRLITKEEEKTN